MSNIVVLALHEFSGGVSFYECKNCVIESCGTQFSTQEDMIVISITQLEANSLGKLATQPVIACGTLDELPVHISEPVLVFSRPLCESLSG